MARDTFETWMEKVNKILLKRLGVSTDDLEDQPYRDWYNDEMTPGEVANEVLEVEGFGKE